MHIKIGKDALSAVVKRLLPYVERKATVPILTNLLLVAEHDHITVTATDLEVALTVTAESKVKAGGEGRITVPAHKLADTLAKLKTLEAAEVEIKSDKEHWITLTCGPLTVKIPGMDDKKYPSWAKWPETGTVTVDLNGDTLAGLILRTRYAISGEESRYTLNGALLTFDADRVRMVATDGHQLSVAEHAGNWNPARMLIPAGAVDRLRDLAAFEGKRSMLITHDESKVYARGEDWEFQSRLLTGQFPNWEAVMPKDNRKRITLDAKTLSATVARIASFADERSRATRWELIGGKGLKVSARCTESGEAAEMLTVSCEDDTVIGLVIGLDADYVQNVLKAMATVKDQQVTLAIRDSQSAASWFPAEAESHGNGWKWESVIMPIYRYQLGRRNENERS